MRVRYGSIVKQTRHYLMTRFLTFAQVVISLQAIPTRLITMHWRKQTSIGYSHIEPPLEEVRQVVHTSKPCQLQAPCIDNPGSTAYKSCRWVIRQGI
jgi:hypothetical protein